jgi:hypothetical protein
MIISASYLTELDEQGYRYYFQYTVMDNPRLIDPKTPPLDMALPSKLPVARRFPSELKATPKTVLVWPRNINGGCVEFRSHILAVVS